MTERTFIHEIEGKYDLESELEIYLQFFTETENTDFIYKNKLDKACFEHDMAYGKSKDLTKRTQSDKF